MKPKEFNRWTRSFVRLFLFWRWVFTHDPITIADGDGVAPVVELFDIDDICQGTC